MATLFSDYDGAPVKDPDELNFQSRQSCDQCPETGLGIMFHAAGRTGRVCPVMFICDTCLKDTHGDNASTGLPFHKEYPY